MKQIRIANVKIDCVDKRSALDYALDPRHAPCFVVTPNALMLEDCRHSPSHAALLNRASLALADGMGVVLAARRQGTPLPARVAGIEFGEALLARAAALGLRVFLLGGGDGVAERAAARLQARYPGLLIVGTFWGYFDRTGEEDRTLTHVLHATRPDILLVCMGYPLQEEWIAAHLDALSHIRVLVGLGGSLDVWAGECRRAPRALSALGLEWAWRILCQPRRRLEQIPALARFAVFAAKNDRKKEL